MRPLPDAAGRIPGGGGLAFGDGGQRRVQEPGVVVRADPSRRGGLRGLRVMPAPRHPAAPAALAQAAAVLGDAR